MRSLFLYFILSATVSCLTQSLLCRKAEKGILRYSTLIFMIIPMVLGGITLLTQCKGIFGGLGMIAAAFWFANACCAALGYGAAWVIFLYQKKGKNKN